MKGRLRYLATMFVLIVLGFAAQASSQTYSWLTGPWSECSESCGGGTQFRTVICVDDVSGQTVADSLCSAEPKPATSRECNTEPCTYSWLTGSWGECSESCGGGTQFREVICVEDATGQPVEDSYCSPELEPVSSQVCNTAPCAVFSDGFEGGDTTEWSIAFP